MLSSLLNENRTFEAGKVSALFHLPVFQNRRWHQFAFGGNEKGGDYRLLADFNNTVLAGHSTRYGVEFITWDRTQNRIALDQGHYYGPRVGVGGYTAANQDFATRSGLIDKKKKGAAHFTGNGLLV